MALYDVVITCHTHRRRSVLDKASFGSSYALLSNWLHGHRNNVHSSPRHICTTRSQWRLTCSKQARIWRDGHSHANPVRQGGVWTSQRSWRTDRRLVLAVRTMLTSSVPNLTCTRIVQLHDGFPRIAPVAKLRVHARWRTRGPRACQTYDCRLDDKRLWTSSVS